MKNSFLKITLAVMLISAVACFAVSCGDDSIVSTQGSGSASSTSVVSQTESQPVSSSDTVTSDVASSETSSTVTSPDDPASLVSVEQISSTASEQTDDVPSGYNQYTEYPSRQGGIC